MVPALATGVPTLNAGAELAARANTIAEARAITCCLVNMSARRCAEQLYVISQHRGLPLRVVRLHRTLFPSSW